jgi:beta-galactosidase
MKTFLISASILLLMSCSNAGKNTDSFIPAGNVTDFIIDNDWRFHRGDTAGAESPDFDDSGWRMLDLPHDWSIEDIPGTGSPVDPAAAGGLDAGYFVGGTGWYRKAFLVPGKTEGKRFMIQFDGIYMNADVWLNGKHLGNHPYGYTSFRYDISDELLTDKENIIAVRVKNEGHNSRWYTGSGIYRHVRMSIDDPVHLDPWSVFVTTKVHGGSADIISAVQVFNESDDDQDIMLNSHILSASGNEITSAERECRVKARSGCEIINTVPIPAPQLWSPENPCLYSAVNEVLILSPDGTRIKTDETSTAVGIRTVAIDATKGFMINGEPVELKGACMHHDNGPLGAAAFDRAEERRVELMKANGFNAIRCSHNPPSQAFLDACDRLGILVIDESFDMWTEPKNPDDYHLYFKDWWQKDVESMVRRDRNHPSVVLWSIGNEIPERGKPEGAKLAAEQVAFIRSLDSTRMITSAVNSLDPDKDPYFSTLDLCGYNYAADKYVSDHKRLPGRIIVSTESFPLEAFEYWTAAADHPWVIGDFVWTGFDYLGEASIGWLGYPHDKSFYPWTHAYCGDIDICGFKRPQSYYRDALWKENQLSVFVKPPVPSFPINPEKASWSKWEWHDVVSHWNWEGYEGKEIQVEVYSSCEEVEMQLNDKSLGRKASGRENKYTTIWTVPYSPGSLIAKGYKSGNLVSSYELRTAGKPSSIWLRADRDTINAGGQDLCYVTVELVDGNGARNQLSNDPVTFEISGPGIIQAVGSSNPMGTESFTRPHRNAYQGRCLVIIRSGKEKGETVLKATSEKTGSKEIKIQTI